MTRVPFGKDGDFITSADISQLFGEVIAIWLLNYLESTGTSEKFSLVELGPGRGTMMADILGVVRQFPQYYELLEVHLLEASALLREVQREALREHEGVFWHCKLEDLPQRPTIMVANEFFDALPIKQFVSVGGVWQEHYVRHDDGKLDIVAMKASCDVNVRNMSDGSVFEKCAAASEILQAIEERIVRHGGAGIVFDYGYLHPPYRSTIQAVKDHQYCSFLDHIGECDITAHVDFGFLRSSLKKISSRVTTQKEFLYKFGIRERLECLSRNATPQQVSELKRGFLRLTENMGTLFKVLMLNC
ncbi:MAG: class I SAM-dependent methyltransferase [Anaplasma sp.]